MNNKEVSKEWFNYAENDLSCAKFLLNMYPKPYEIICYHCQQSAEKYLKGYLVLLGEPILKTHDLTILNKVCIKHDADFKQIEEDCIELVDYGVNIRYPFFIDLQEYDVKKALNSAERIKEFIMNKL